MQGAKYADSSENTPDKLLLLLLENVIYGMNHCYVNHFKKAEQLIFCSVKMKK